MKKIIVVLLLVISAVALTGCTKKEAIEFKNEYESLNGKVNAKGVEHRNLNINSNNPYVKVDAKEIIKKIDKKESFYVYFGDKLCPWCRSVIEKSIEIANKKKIKTIYYVAIWDDEGNEILRDKFVYEKQKLIKKVNGTDEYYKFLDIFNDLLDDYNVYDENDKEISTHEKRIFAPNFFYVEKGVPISMTDGISALQKDAREELTEEILKEEEELFTEFFSN